MVKLSMNVLVLLSILLFTVQFSSALIDPKDLTEMGDYLVELTNSTQCNTCSDQYLPLLNDMAWKYSANTGDQIFTLFNTSIPRVKNQLEIRQVIKTISPSIIDNKQLTKINQDKKEIFLSKWLTIFGIYPPGNGQPIENVLNYMAEYWASPKSNLIALIESKAYFLLLNRRPMEAEPVMMPLENYMISLHSLVEQFKSVCTEQLKCH